MEVMEVNNCLHSEAVLRDLITLSFLPVDSNG